MLVVDGCCLGNQGNKFTPAPTARLLMVISQHHSKCCCCEGKRVKQKTQKADFLNKGILLLRNLQVQKDT